jgi:hypothetical protein
MSVKERFDKAVKEFESKNPQPSPQDTEAIRAWRARRRTAEESDRADRDLSRNLDASVKFAKCNNCAYGTAEWIQSRKDAADAARDKDNAVRAMNKALKESYVAAAAIYSPPATNRSRNFYAKAVHSGNPSSIYLSVQKAVDEDPSVIAARASVARVLANEQPPGKREAWINSDENSFSSKAAVKQRESTLKSGNPDNLLGAIAQISRFVEEAEAIKPAVIEPSVIVAAQAQSAMRPLGATPVARLKPIRPVPRKPLPKLRRR